MQRSRLSFFHRSNQKEDLNERRTSLFKQWGIVILSLHFYWNSFHSEFILGIHDKGEKKRDDRDFADDDEYEYVGLSPEDEEFMTNNNIY